MYQCTIQVPNTQAFADETSTGFFSLKGEKVKLKPAQAGDGRWVALQNHMCASLLLLSREVAAPFSEMFWWKFRFTEQRDNSVSLLNK